MGTPPTPPPALRPTPAHSDTSYTLKCEEPFKEYRAYAPDELRLRLACLSFLRNAAFEQRRAGNIDDSTFEYIRDCLDTETRHIEGPLEVE